MTDTSTWDQTQTLFVSISNLDVYRTITAKAGNYALYVLFWELLWRLVDQLLNSCKKPKENGLIFNFFSFLWKIWLS